MKIEPTPTPDTIAAAKAYQKAEREKLCLELGLIVNDDGRIVRIIDTSVDAPVN